MSNNFNKLEIYISIVLNHSPKIKKIIKRIYKILCYLIYAKKNRIKTDCNIISIGNKNEESFFGYYDKFPMNKKGYILFHSTDQKTYRKPNPKKHISINLYDFSNKQVLFKETSFSYNWQQGARLHWLNHDLFIFNDFSQLNRNYISKVFSVKDFKLKKIFQYPVQDTFQTDFFLSLNYRRLYTFRPDYGYFNLPKLSPVEINNYAIDGIWHIDYNSEISCLLFSLENIIEISYKKEFQNSKHWINHIMISPSGNHAIFLHRYIYLNKKYDRLLLADINNRTLDVLVDNGMVSHCCWVDNKSVLGYLRGNDRTDSYYFIDIYDKSMKKFSPQSLGKLGDGHPSSSKSFFVTDTYPNKAHMQNLIIADEENKRIEVIATLLHDIKYFGETRCDLHPRISKYYNTIFFDSVYTGKRKLYKMDLV